MDQAVAPHPDRSALLTIDVQRDFALPSGAAEIQGTADVLPAIERLVGAFRDAGRPIVHVVRLYRRDGSNADRCRRRTVANGPPVVAPGTDGAELVEAVEPAPDVSLEANRLLSGSPQRLAEREYAMFKPRWGAFYDTPLEERLLDWAVDTVVVCGCNFPNCPRTTIYEASERDFRIQFVPEATSGTYDRGLAELRDIGVAVADVDQTVAWLAGE